MPHRRPCQRRRAGVEPPLKRGHFAAAGRRGGGPISHSLSGGGGGGTSKGSLGSNIKLHLSICTVEAFENASGGGWAACSCGASEAAAPSSSSATPLSLLFPRQGRGRGCNSQCWGSRCLRLPRQALHIIPSQSRKWKCHKVPALLPGLKIKNEEGAASKQPPSLWELGSMPRERSSGTSKAPGGQRAWGATSLEGGNGARWLHPWGGGRRDVKSNGRKGRGAGWGWGRLPRLCVCGAALGCETSSLVCRDVCVLQLVPVGRFSISCIHCLRGLCGCTKACLPLQGPRGRDPHPSRPSPHHRAGSTPPGQGDMGWRGCSRVPVPPEMLLAASDRGAQLQQEPSKPVSLNAPPSPAAHPGCPQPVVPQVLPTQPGC